MADENESDAEKTDFVSQRRVDQAWEEGRIPMGKEAPSVVALLAGLAALSAVGPRLFASLVHLVADNTGKEQASIRELWRSCLEPVGLGLVVIAVAATAALAVTVAQTRGRFWAELALPNVERLSQGRLTRFMSSEFWVELATMTGKVLVVAGIAYLTVKDDLLSLSRLFSATPAAQLTATFGPMTTLTLRAVMALAVFAAIELGLTHYRFREKMKMTREEAKREAKEDEGDPMLKQRRKKRARELSKGRIAAEVPRADAIVVNPTHIAIAIRYRKNEGGSPRVIAKGKGQAAENIRELAREHGIPIVQDIPLARLLYKKVKVGKAVPAETFKAVAAILAFVYRVTGRKPGEPSAVDRAA